METIKIATWGCGNPYYSTLYRDEHGFSIQNLTQGAVTWKTERINRRQAERLIRENIHNYFMLFGTPEPIITCIAQDTP